MGRLTKKKIDEIAKLRQEGYTQKETAEKMKVHLRTVRKYDPLREQKSVRLTPEQVRHYEELCDELAVEGLLDKVSDGRVRINSLGRKFLEIFRELETRAILNFMVEVDRPVSEEETDRHLELIGDELWAQALSEAKRELAH